MKNSDSEGDFVSFLLCSKLAGMCFNPHRREPLTFVVPDAPGIKVVVRSCREPDSFSAGFDDLECKTTLSLPASTEVTTFIAGLAEDRYEQVPGIPVSLPVRVRGEERIDSTGRLVAKMMVPFELYPPSVRELWKTAWDKLIAAQERFLRLLRWHQDISSPPYLYDSEPMLYWRSSRSGAGVDHCLAAFPSSICDRRPKVFRLFGIRWDALREEAIGDIWNRGDFEPVAHELLREARILAESGHVRSALLIAATSVETAVKDHIRSIKPDTDWLLANLPSPPVHKILRKYLPELHERHPWIRDWRVLVPLWNRCEKLFDARNQTAHKGAPQDRQIVAESIEVASDIVYLLDVLAGHAWARERVGREVREALQWPPPSDFRGIAIALEDKWEIDPPASSE